MKDQATKLANIGIPAVTLSDISEENMKVVERGAFSVVYESPEERWPIDTVAHRGHATYIFISRDKDTVYRAINSNYRAINLNYRAIHPNYRAMNRKYRAIILNL